MDYKNGCLLCGAELVYLDAPQEMECAFCHRTFMADAQCENGHFVCNECHAGGAIAVITEICRQTDNRDPLELAVEIMRQPSIHMHGPEHHVLVGSVLVAAYRNCGGEVDLDRALAEVARRGQQVPGGVCGFWGCCGAAVSAGMFVSVVSGSTPMKEDEWGLSNLMTSAALRKIGEIGGPRCCKRDSFIAIQEAVAFSAEHFGVQMELPVHVSCEFIPLNAQCIGRRCPFHPAKG